MMIDRNCVVCGKRFKIYPSRMKEKNRGKYCSRSCFKSTISELCSMEKNPNWRGGRKNKNGYIQIRTRKNLYEFEHRVVAEQMLGRKLVKGEIVHHINGIKNDNRPENLVVIGSQSEHAKNHAKNHSCPTCGRYMPRG